MRDIEWDLKGTKKMWDDPTLHVVQFPFKFDEAHFNAWFESLAGEKQASSISNVLERISTCLEHFQTNVKDCQQALEQDQQSSSGIKWQHRLGPLLRLTILQHLRLFDLFRYWAKDRQSKPSTHDDPVKPLKNIGQQTTDIKRALSQPVFRLNHQDTKATGIEDLSRKFGFLEGKWICRSVLEIRLLVLRCRECDESTSVIDNEYQRSTENEKRALEKFLIGLQRRHLLNDQDDNQAVPCVPEVICFDETSRTIAASRPWWPSNENEDPWQLDGGQSFFTQSRDSRICRELTQYHFVTAEAAFEKLTKELYNHGSNETFVRNILFGADIHPTGCGLTKKRRRQLQREQRRFHEEFGTRYFGPLRQYEQHVWQAINGRNFKFKNQCLRCQVYYNARLVNENQPVWTADTKSDSRVGSCAESCLHAEQAIRI